MRLKICIVAAALLSSSQFSSASDDTPKVNFDQGVDASALLQRARELAAKQVTPIPRVERKLLKLKRKNTVAGPGQYQPVSPLITSSASYPLGVNLRVDPKYPALDPAVLKPLEADWTDITAVRSDLLSQASIWDGGNEQLYRDGEQLDQDLAGLELRRTNLNTEIDQFNQACPNRPLPPDQYKKCVAWRDDLIRRKSQLESDITQYNGRVNSWNQRSSAIFQRRGTLVGLIEGWERRIQQWIETTRKAMEAVCRKPYQIAVKPDPENVPAGGISRPFEAMVYFRENPVDAPECPLDLSWTFEQHPEIPNTSIGTISPRSGERTIFTSGNFTGLGNIFCTDLNSGVGTFAVVHVYNPAAR